VGTVSGLVGAVVEVHGRRLSSVSGTGAACQPSPVTVNDDCPLGAGCVTLAR
jgi:hypothetical protein